MPIKYYKTAMLVLPFLWLTSCVDEFWPELTKYENLLVVDGGINNGPPPYTIKLSKSSPLDSAQLIPFPGCIVSITASDGYKELLTEVEEGVYKTSVAGIQGVAGLKYRLNIETPSGKTYESSFDKIEKAVLIDNVYAEIEEHKVGGYDHPLQGYQFYLDTETATSDSTYFIWRMEAAFHYQSEYYIHWYWQTHLERFNPTDSLYNCWTTYSLRDIYTYNTSSLTSNKLSRFPLNFVSTEDRKLTVRYSLLVRQYSVNKTAYMCWSSLEKQNADQGSLYSHQPYQIKGNVTNIKQPDEPVLGYFLVSGIDSKRIFVDRPDLPFYYNLCNINDGNYKAYTDLGMGSPYDPPQYIILYKGIRAVPGQPCADCRLRGGTIVKPDFWED